jgi:Zn ribbon nucleic-acid-binding protein
MVCNRTQDSVYKEHALQNKELKGFLRRFMGDLYALPVCPRCEKLGLRDQGWRVNRIMSCPDCGYHGPTTKTYGEFLEEALYK